MTSLFHHTVHECRGFLERVFCARVEWRGACWQWVGMTASDPPYGQITIGRKKMQAHRFAYEFFCGPIQPGHIIHHKCENTLCVNPQHLQPLPAPIHTSMHIRSAAGDRWRAMVQNQGYGQLTDRQLEVLSYIGDGFSTKEIADIFGLSVKGIEFHRASIIKKMCIAA